MGTIPKREVQVTPHNFLGSPQPRAPVPGLQPPGSPPSARRRRAPHRATPRCRKRGGAEAPWRVAGSNYPEGNFSLGLGRAAEVVRQHGGPGRCAARAASGRWRRARAPGRRRRRARAAGCGWCPSRAPGGRWCPARAPRGSEGEEDAWPCARPSSSGAFVAPGPGSYGTASAPGPGDVGVATRGGWWSRDRRELQRG